MLDDSSELVPLEELSDLLSSLLVSELDPLLLSEPSSELDPLLLPEPSSELPPSLEEFSLDESLLSSSLLELELVLDFLLLLRTQQKHFQQDLCKPKQVHTGLQQRSKWNQAINRPFKS